MSLSKEVKELLQDPEAIWEALSVQGVSYPFDDELYEKTASQKREIHTKTKIFDDERAIAIGNMVLAHHNAIDGIGGKIAIDIDAVLGAIVRKQIIKHLEK